MFKRRMISSMVCLALTACGSSSDSETGTDIETTTVPELNEPKVALTNLAKLGSDKFQTYLKNGLFLRHNSGLLTEADDTSQDSPTASPSVQTNTVNEGKFSTTIVQEQGVDEADRIKYDGDYLYVAANTYYNAGIKENTEEEVGVTSVRVLKRNQDNGTIRHISDIVVSESASNIDALYLGGDTLSVISHVNNFVTYGGVAGTFDMFLPIAQSFELSFIDTATPEDSFIKETYTVDGYVIDSRRVNDTLYLVSSFSPTIDNMPYADTEQQRLDNYNSIQNISISELMPKYTNLNGDESSLISADNECYLPQEATDKDGYDGIVVLTAIDMNDPTNISAVCINTQVQGIYATQGSVYLYGTHYNYDESNSESTETSVIHKFGVDGQTIDYAASGHLNGRLGWSNNSNLRFSEQGDYLRVMTTAGGNWEENGFDHRLNILSQQGTELSLVSQLPNDANPEIFGKTDEKGRVIEDIKAVRYYQNKAFVVTFENTDPLYVVDLTDNLNPEIAGSLEIPGYSAYLHPLSDNLLVGIGQNVDPSSFMSITLDGSVPISVDSDGGIGDGAGPIPVDDNNTTTDGTQTTDETPIPVDSDDGIGDGAGPIPVDDNNTTTDGTQTTDETPVPVDSDGGIGDGAGPISLDANAPDDVNTAIVSKVILKRTPVIEGAKITLFDISVIDAPREINSIVYADGYTPVEFDYHALTYLKVDDKHRFAMPVERWISKVYTSDDGQKADVWSPQNSLELIEVTGSDANAEMNSMGKVMPTGSSDTIDVNSYISGWEDRAVFHSNDIYYVHGNQVWQSIWTDPYSVTGPF